MTIVYLGKIEAPVCDGKFFLPMKIFNPNVPSEDLGYFIHSSVRHGLPFISIYLQDRENYLRTKKEISAAGGMEFPSWEDISKYHPMTPTKPIDIGEALSHIEIHKKGLVSIIGWGGHLKILHPDHTELFIKSSTASSLRHYNSSRTTTHNTPEAQSHHNYQIR